MKKVLKTFHIKKEYMLYRKIKNKKSQLNKTKPRVIPGFGMMHCLGKSGAGWITYSINQHSFTRKGIFKEKKI